MSLKNGFPHAQSDNGTGNYIKETYKGCIVWLTGLSGSGKTTIARALEKKLLNMGCHVYVIDGDIVRTGLCSDLGFSPEDRSENIRRTGHVVAILADAGVIAVAAFISPYAADRDKVRTLAVEGRFFEVYVSAPVNLCRERDPKNLYKLADSRKISEFTGVSAPYEPPKRPELILDTSAMDIGKCVEAILSMLKSAGII